MLPAIDFDSEADGRTIKINNVSAEWMLAAKAQTVQVTALQNIPKLSFSPRGIVAQSARASSRPFGS